MKQTKAICRKIISITENSSSSFVSILERASWLQNYGVLWNVKYHASVHEHFYHLVFPCMLQFNPDYTYRILVLSCFMPEMSCLYPAIKPGAIKTFFNIKWIPAGRQEKGEQCFLWLVMFRHCYSEMLFPLWIQKFTICKSLKQLHALYLQLQLQYLPRAQIPVNLIPYWWPLPGQRLLENKAPSADRTSFNSLKTP